MATPTSTPGYIDHIWSGAPPAMNAALATLGHPDFAPAGAVRDARVVAFGPVKLETVAGRIVSMALIRTADTVTLPLPTGVFNEGGSAVASAVGRFFDVPREISIRQFLKGAAEDKILTEAEALAAAQTGAVPAFVEAVFAQMPAAMAWSARMDWTAMYSVELNHPLLVQIAAMRGMSEADRVASFIRWSKL